MEDAEYAETDEAGQLALGVPGEQRSLPGLADNRKPLKPCPSCGRDVIQTGDGRHPCSYCGGRLV